MGNPFETSGAFSWNELLTSDVESAKAFYSELLGWELEAAPMPGMDYTVVNVAGQPVGGIMRMPPEVPAGVPPHWGVYVTVDDVDATAGRVQQLGGQVLMPPRDIPQVGRFAVIQDPQGAVLSIIKYMEQ